MEALSLAEVMVDERPQAPEKRALLVYEESSVDPEALRGVGPASGAKCALDGCDDPVASCGLCAKHHRFWRRNGTEALNRRAKKVPQTREEARALLFVRAIELADAEDVEAAEKRLEEAARFFGDPEYREKYDRRREALYQGRRRAEGKATPFSSKRAEAHKARLIAEGGPEAWKDYKRQQYQGYKRRYIEEHGEEAWREKVNAASLRHYHKKKAEERAAKAAAASAHGA